MAKFEPSEQSFNPGTVSKARLKQVLALAEVLTKDLPEDKDLPPWVVVQIAQATNALALVHSYNQARKKGARGRK